MAGVMRKWTPERDALLVEMHVARVKDKAALLALNQMPGPGITSEDALGIRRSWLRRNSEAHAEVLARAVVEGEPPVWTAERDALLMTLAPVTRDYAGMQATLNLLPGTPIATPGAVRQRKCSLRQLRSAQAAEPTNSQGLGPADTAHAAAGTFPAACEDVSSLNSPPAPKEPGAHLELGALLVSYDQARRWALRNGLCTKYTGLNLIAVNAEREARGQVRLAIRGAL